MRIITLSVLLVCYLTFREKNVSAGCMDLVRMGSGQFFLGQLIKIFSGCEPTYKLTYFDIRGRAEWIRQE